MRLGTYGLALACLFLVIGCGTSVRVAYQEPAEVNMAGREVIVVKPIVGRGGDVITSRLREALQRSNFELVDREDEALGIIGKEHTLGGGSPQLIHGATALYGKVVVHNASQNTRQVNYMVNGVNRTGYQTSVTVNLEVSMNVTDLKTSKNIATSSVRVQKNGQTDITPHPVAADPANIFDEAYSEAVDQFMKKIAVHDVWVNVHLTKVEGLPQNQAGVTSFLAGDYTNAAASFDEAIEASKSMPQLSASDRANILHHAGLAHEWLYQYAVAMDRYNAAVKMNPNSNYANSIARCQRRIRQNQELENQGVVQ